MRKILSIDKDSADAMNALGYTWVDLNKNLEEAEALILKAYQMIPDNVAVIDSVGWLHFRKGDYKKAIKFVIVILNEIERILFKAAWIA